MPLLLWKLLLSDVMPLSKTSACSRLPDHRGPRTAHVCVVHASTLKLLLLKDLKLHLVLLLESRMLGYARRTMLKMR